jgi:hypothetical protein
MLTPDQRGDLTLFEHLGAGELLRLALHHCPVPWVRAAGAAGGDRHEPHGLYLLPVAGDTGRVLAFVVTINRDQPPRSATLALLREDDRWRCETFVDRARPPATGRVSSPQFPQPWAGSSPLEGVPA